MGLIQLGRLFGIEREEIMACGDGNNDLMMLKEVGFGVAMANGADEVKEVADYITLSNEEDDAAAAIEKFVLTPRGIERGQNVRCFNCCHSGYRGRYHRMASNQ